MIKYTHKEDVHNLESPNIIVPQIIKLLNPGSVVDIGCGLGTFLKAFKQLGVSDVLGVDGSWVEKDLLYKNIQPVEFLERDLEKEIQLKKKYDLVLSLEVAEHLSEKSADIFIQTLVNAGGNILFSAAIPNQGGQNHINEQWLTYWEAKFAKHNYIVHDVIRDLFWDNPKVFWWYKQNMVLVTPKDFQIKNVKKDISMRNIVHYELFEKKVMELENTFKGGRSPKFYIKGLLFSVFGYEKIKKLQRILSRT